MNTKTGEYITELEALQVVAGDVLKENKKVRLVGEAGEMGILDGSSELIDAYDIEQIFAESGISVNVTRKDMAGTFYSFIFETPIAISQAVLYSNWEFENGKSAADYPDGAKITEGTIRLDVSGGYRGIPKTCYPSVRFGVGNDASVWFSGREVNAEKADVVMALVHTIDRALSFIDVDSE